MAAGDRLSDPPNISASATNITDSIDCGVGALRCCRGPSCQQYARLRTFVAVLAVAGMLQGAAESYFRVSAKEAALENGYNPLIVEWLLVSSGLFQAIFALCLAHWAHKMHPISWLGGTIMLQAAMCIIAIIPSIINYSDGIVVAVQPPTSDVCVKSLAQSQRQWLTAEQSRVGTLVLLFVLQFALGMGSLAFYTIGVTYLDDNSKSIDSPSVIGAALAARIFGLQIGVLIVFGVNATSLGWWLGWAILAPLIFISAFVLSLYPRRLPKTIIHQAAQRIIEETSDPNQYTQLSTHREDAGFCASVKRIFANNLLMFNLLSVMFIQAATVNYMAQEESYLQSRFYLPYSEQDGLMQEFRSNFILYFLKPPVAAAGMLIGGLIISKLKLSGRKITAINFMLGVHLLAIYIAYIFIDCELGPLAQIVNGKLKPSYCSKDCICSPVSFDPVCPVNSSYTYFSACYAGCKRKTTINSIEIYEGCTCGSNPEDLHNLQNLQATKGACSAQNCASSIIAFQVLSLTAAGLLGMMTIGKILITLRSVLPQDKGLALGMELMIVGFFSYVPVHLAYDVVTRVTCLYWAPDYAWCLLRESPKHGNILNILTASLIFLGLLFDVLVFIFVKGLNIYHCKVTDTDYTPAVYAAVPHEDEQESPSSGVPMVSGRGGGSPATTVTDASVPTQRTEREVESKPIRQAPSPHPSITVFRNPSSVTSSSAGENSIEQVPGVTYAQVVFPPDRHKPADGSPKRLAVRADVPLHLLSEQDVRAQLGNLRSFSIHNTSTTVQAADFTSTETTPLDNASAAAVTPVTPSSIRAPIESDALRPQSPETAL